MRTATLLGLAVLALVATLCAAQDVAEERAPIPTQVAVAVPNTRNKRSLLLAKGLLVGGALGAGALGAGALGLGAVGLGAGVVGAGALGLGAG
ncbi:elastin-like [Frankliniella occidentalis]|uniref:Elastin-like n=1 Tax=Frankliniella occidentalis TaxID=133901 RepID=A0A9C6WXP5_FRAOC|nr:elastin-like [Frankliniella occidentalis]